MDSLTISPHINSNECYSEKYNISFVHIPKNAGTSITKFLGTNNNFFVHINWSAIKKPQVPTFAVVRNPYDRLVSIYKYNNYEFSFKEFVETIRDSHYLNFTNWVRGYPSLGPVMQYTSDITNICPWEPTNYYKHPQVGQIWNEIIFTKLKCTSTLFPQCESICHVTKYLFNNHKPIYGDIQVDYIVKFENLEKDLSKILKTKVKLPHLNEGKKDNWKSYYESQDLADIVYDLYKDDFEKLGYIKESYKLSGSGNL
jgi:hypothetical protein